MENENYQELANAIIIRAAKDYRILLRYRQKHPGNAEIERRINKLEREIHITFFRARPSLMLMKYFQQLNLNMSSDKLTPVVIDRG